MKRSGLLEWSKGLSCAQLAKKCCEDSDYVCPCKSSHSKECPYYFFGSECKSVTKDMWEKILNENEEDNSPRGDVLLAAHKIVNGERKDQYGNPEDNFANIANYWTQYKGVSFSAHDVAMMMVLLKIARIQTGVGKEDNYIDLCGYGALAEDMFKHNN